MKSYSLAAAFAAALFFSSCATAPPSGTWRALSSLEEITGKWRLVSGRSNHQSLMTLRFAGSGTASGTVACNSFSGRPSLNADTLTIENIDMTTLGCAGYDHLAQANDALRSLGSVNRASLSATADTLRLQGAQTLTFERVVR